MSTRPNLPNGKGERDVGQAAGYAKEKFAKPFEAVDSGIVNMDQTYDDIGEKSGFQANTDHYIVKKGMVYGEAAKLNIMPAGMDINDQPYRDIRDMKLRVYTGGMGYSEDGGFPFVDLKEDYGSKGSTDYSAAATPTQPDSFKNTGV